MKFRNTNQISYMHHSISRPLTPIVHRVSRSCLVLAAIFTLCSCETVDVQSQTKETVNNPTAQDDNPDLQSQINRLLDLAYTAYEANQLTTPLDNNAYYSYLRVLSLDPTNRYAEQGIAEIVEKYLEWAISAARVQQFRKATNYLNKARSIDEIHPNIDAVAKMISGRRSLNHTVYPLPLVALDLRETDLIDTLHDIGRQIEIKSATVIIAARNDEDGRWIYQQLNEATASRVRATFESAPTPSIRLVFHAPVPQK